MKKSPSTYTGNTFRDYTRCFYSGCRKLCSSTANFVSENIYPISMAGIPIGMAMALSDCDYVREAGYAMMGAGTAELIECIKNKKKEKERERFMKEINIIRKDVKEIRKLEEEEMGLLSGSGGSGMNKAA